MLALVIYVASCALVLGGLPRLAARARRRGIGGGELMSPVDEIFHPVAYQARQETQACEERAEPTPDSDGGRSGLL